MQLFDFSDEASREFTLGVLLNRFQHKQQFEKLDKELNELTSFANLQDSLYNDTC